MIKVNGVEMPTPSRYNPFPTLREKSTENALGDVVRKIISSRWKLEMSWDYLTKEEYSKLTDIKFKESFDCEFPNSKGQIVTKRMYAGDIKGSANRAPDGIVKDWVNVTCNFIQQKADKFTGGAVWFLVLKSFLIQCVRKL